MQKLAPVFVFSLLLTSCSLLAPSRRASGPSQAPPEYRDVPHQARGADTGLRQRILVLPVLEEKVGSEERVLGQARDVIVRGLLGTGKFVVVNPNDFPEDPKKYLTPDGDYNLAEMAKKLLPMGIAAVLEGKILQVRAVKTGDAVGIFRKVRARVTAKVRVRLYSAGNSKEMLNNVYMASSENEATQVLKRSTYSEAELIKNPGLVRASVAKAFLQSIAPVSQNVFKLKWEGRIALLSGEKVYINAGRMSGIQIGDILKVSEDGKEIFDPETGGFIGKAPGRMKGTVEIVSYFGKDGAIGIVHSGSGFIENDLVEIY